VVDWGEHEGEGERQTSKSEWTFIHEREVIWLERVVLTCVGVWGGIVMPGVS
jgi:hypothetical protein